FAPGEARQADLRVLDSNRHLVLSQVVALESYPDGSLKTAEILFSATIIPGERPRFRLVSDPGLHFSDRDMPRIIARRIGVGRVEMGNERFGVLLNLGLEGTEPALVAAFNKTAGEQRMLNLIDTSPDGSPLPVYGKQGEGFGSFLAGQKREGAFDQVEILEAGPLRARVRFSGAR